MFKKYECLQYEHSIKKYIKKCETIKTHKHTINMNNNTNDSLQKQSQNYQVSAGISQEHINDTSLLSN